MSWLTEILDKISKSYEGLNTSAMKGAGSMGLLNIERTAEKMNPEEAKEFKLKAKANLVTGTMLAPVVPLLVNGLVTAPVTTALELAGGTAAGIGATYATDKAIEHGSNGKYTGFTDYVTKKFPDSNPYIVEQFHPAAWIGGLLGGWGIRNAFIRTPRGRIELVNSELDKNISNTKLNNSEFDKAVLSGKVGWAPALEIHYRHGSETPNLTKFIPYNTWDVKFHGANPYKWFGTEISSPKNMMDTRPYQYKGVVELKKPMVQVGEYGAEKGIKNNTRNLLVDEARKRGADSYYLHGIEDNKAKDQNVLIKFLDSNGENIIFDIPEFIPRISKLTEAERLGIPNSLRNNKILIKDPDDHTKILRQHINEKGEIPEDIQPIPFTEEEIAKAIPEIAENMKYSNRSYLADKNKKYFNAFPNEDNDLIINNIKSYLNQFSDVEINPSFLKKDGNQSHYIAMYRNYMYNMGYDTSNLSNEEIAKLLTLQYNNLTANQTGLMKGQLLWHSSPKIFDEFDWKAHVGDNFGNMGGAGPANYFSLIGGTSYGRAKNPFGEFIFINDQPYLLNNISSTPSRNVLVKKGIKPEYTSPLHSEELNAYKARVIDQALAKTKEGNMLVIDDFMIPVKGIMDNSGQVEFALTRNSGIKSLYPHPSLFVKNPDGTITVTRNWNDLKVNYKQGGSIHIKEKNKGKFTESAKRAGKSVQEYARDVVNNPKATKLQKKRALFALNAKKFKHD